MTRTLDIYCRISVDYDGTLRSVESQEEDCRDAIADNPDWRVGQVFRDHAKSAWNPRTHRPEFEALMARLESGEADGVMVYDLTRFTRKPIEGERLIALAERRVTVASITTTYNITTADGREHFRNVMTRAASESDKISERSSRGKRNKARRGRNVAPQRGFGRDGYLPNPEGWEPGDARVPVPPERLARERTAVREAVAGLLAGATLSSVARTWNEAELLTVNGKRWGGADVRQMLSAPSVAGLAEHKGVIVAELEGEPLLDRATWDRLMLYFINRKHGRPPTKYLLSGIVRCSLCGSKLYGRPLPNHRPYPDGEVRRSYHCMVMEKQEQGCGKLVIDQRLADRHVEHMVIRRLSDPRYTDKVARVAAQMLQSQRVVAAELATLNQEADALVSRLGTPGWTAARIDTAMAQYGDLIQDAEQRLKALGDIPEPAPGSADAEAEWAAADHLARRALVIRAFPEGLSILPSSSRGVGSQNENRLIVGPPA